MIVQVGIAVVTQAGSQRSNRPPPTSMLACRRAARDRPPRPHRAESGLGELAALCERLHWAHGCRAYPEFIEGAEREDWTIHDLLVALARGEVAHRAQNRILGCVRKARFPELKTVEQFDFSVPAELRRTLLGPCFSPEFAVRGRNRILAGRSGRARHTWPSASPKRPSRTA